MFSSTPTIDSVEVERVESDGKKIWVLLSITPVALRRSIGRGSLSLNFLDPYAKIMSLNYIRQVCETEVDRLEAIEKIKEDSEGLVK